MPLKFTSNNIVYTHTTQLHYQIAIRNSLFTFYCLKILTVSVNILKHLIYVLLFSPFWKSNVKIVYYKRCKRFPFLRETFFNHGIIIFCEQMQHWKRNTLSTHLQCAQYMAQIKIVFIFTQLLMFDEL